ncbi:MAG: hypothetical protein CMN28_10095 [Salinisphaeraceae bacterium]|nr:hypothetical protein [Salinisphaeraceae bacterium]
MARLKDRLGATPAELAAWVTFGAAQGCGGLTAYKQASISVSPSVLDFDYMDIGGFDYLRPLMGAWFLAKDVDEFEPQDRFIEYPRLLEHWSDSEWLEDVEAYVEACVHEDRLHEIHPVSGRSQLSEPDFEYERPPRETTLLFVEDVKDIERADGLGVVIAETAAGRKQRIEEMLREEMKARGTYGAQARLARILDIKEPTLSGILKREPKFKP